MATTLGIFNGLLELFSFGASGLIDAESYPYDPIPEIDPVYFKIYTGFHDAVGDLPDARLYDIDGKSIGGALDPPLPVLPGTWGTFVAGIKPGAQPVYTLFSGNYDAICIAFATAVWPEGLGKFGWVGDWGSECATDQSIATWYFSKIAIPGTEHFPNCMWVDLDGGAPATGFQVNWLDITPSDSNDPRIGQKAHDMCQTPSFYIYQHYDPNSIIYHGKGAGRQPRDQARVLKRSEPAPPRKRTQPQRSATEAKFAFEKQWRDKVVVDDVPSHNARALCESNTSAGPSFVNPEDGYFCDMRTKKIHPVCKEKDGKSVCFDVDQNNLVGPGIQKRSTPFEVIDWRLSRMNGTAESQDA